MPLHLIKWLLAFACVFPLYSQAVTVCDVDEFLVGSYLGWHQSGNAELAYEMLEFLAENSGKVISEECDESRKADLIRKVNSLAPFESYNKATLNEEEYAVLDLLLDYVWSKYNSQYAYMQKEKIRTKEGNGDNILVRLVSELSGIGYDALISVAKGTSVASLAVEKTASWAYLWVRKDNPFPHWEYADLNYSWLIQKKEIVKEAFTESRYSKMLDALVTDELEESARQSDRRRLNFHFGMGLLFGRSFGKTEMGPYVNDWEFSYVSARFQIYRVLFMLQLDMSTDLKTDAVDILGGFAILDSERYGIDILGGVGYTECKFTDPSDPDGEALEGSSVNVALGIQAMRKFSMADMFDIMPKIQYLFKYGPYENPVTDRFGYGISQYLYIGFAFDAKVPMGKARK